MGMDSNVSRDTRYSPFHTVLGVDNANQTTSASPRVAGDYPCYHAKGSRLHEASRSNFEGCWPGFRDQMPLASRLSRLSISSEPQC
jgi:hypothetical protein